MSVSSTRPEGFGATLARLGFEDVGRVEQLLHTPAAAQLRADEASLTALGRAPDPDLALVALLALAGVVPDAAELMRELHGDPVLRGRLFAVLGTSAALGEVLVRHPDAWHPLRGPKPLEVPDPRAALLAAVGGDPAAEMPVAAAVAGRDDCTSSERVDAMRAAYRRQLVIVAARDLAGEAGLVATASDLADLAAAALEASLAIARADEPDHGVGCRLSVIGMGKCGGRELNYVSDVDVIFVVEPAEGAGEAAARATGTRLAQALMRACHGYSNEPALWEVDAALRPEGKTGPLVRTLASHVAYYERWAKTWEFQALLKARPVAGDVALGEAYVEALSPMVWSASQRVDFVEDVQKMRRRVEQHIPRDLVDRQLKLGPGGLRDVEFAVQLLQLVHGRDDPSLRSATTLEALAALSALGYVGRDDGAALDGAYRFLRTLEHRIQIFRLRRTHLVPEDVADLRRIGRSLGLRREPAENLIETWRGHALEVRRIHEKIFYRPLLQAVARLAPGEARLGAAAARARLEALGYSDPAGALRHIEALTAGISRRAAIQRTLLPVMLGWFADAADPDAGLLAFRQVSDALGSTHWYLRELRDEGAAAQRMACVLASSRYVADLLLRAPEAVAMLGDDEELAPRSAEATLDEALASSGRHLDPVHAAVAVRAVRRRELVRVAVADVLDFLDVDQVGEALTDIAAATLNGGLDAAVRATEAERRSPLPTRIAVIAMGRFGGHELSYSSDADVLFVHDPWPGADEREAGEAAHAVANELRRLLALPAPDPPMLVDADLRPEGRQGPLVRTLSSYAAYYERWSLIWESQALLRAVPVAGDADLGRRFMDLVNPVRWPAGGLDEADIREVRRVKARVEAERLPRNADRATHLKLGPGGLSDVEWTVQLLQLRHAHELEALRTTRTLPALEGARAAGLIDDADASALAASWGLASRVRNAAMLVRGRTTDEFPKDMRELAGTARLVGYAPAATGELLEDYRRTSRRARAVVERIFFG